MKVIKLLEENKIEYSSFNDSDLNMGITAVCTAPITGEQRQIFKKYQLL